MIDIHKRLRILELYAVASSLIFVVLLAGAFTPQKQKFGEIDVERLNVIEKNGQLRVVIANSDRIPDPVVDGKSFKTERVPGHSFLQWSGR